MMGEVEHHEYNALTARIQQRDIRVAVIGLGYLGLPLAMSVSRSGMEVLAFDIDPSKLEKLRTGTSYIDGVENKEVSRLVDEKRLIPESDFSRLEVCDVILICVPTPLSRYREPDLSFIIKTTELISKTLRRNQIIILESTTWPGTTVEVVKPILERIGLNCGSDFWLGFSPERGDPGRKDYKTENTPKIVSGCERRSLNLISCFYQQFIDEVVAVNSTKIAEAAKLTENVFRAVNIALANELKTIYAALDIDVWEVIDAAASKPFGYMPFYPGPGLGGHCIPIDPFYLTWKAKEKEHCTRFIELAGEINLSMPGYVVNQLEHALDRKLKKSLSSSRILLIGLAYKRNVADIRESPALKILEFLHDREVKTLFHDPFYSEIPDTRQYKMLKGKRSVGLSAASIDSVDAILIVTDHDNIDYGLIAESGKLVVDTRNVIRRKGLACSNLVLA